MSPRPLTAALRVALALALAGLAAMLTAALLRATLWAVATPGAVALALAGLLAALTLRELRRGEHAAEIAAEHDDVTGLPTAARLRRDLELALAHAGDDQRRMGRADAAEDERRVLILLTVEGFKKYNDSYGRPCGDVLLAWLAGKLRDAVGARGVVYRMRGSDFAVLVVGDTRAVADVRAAAEHALFDLGDGFMVWSAHGEVTLPAEATTVADALKLADQRLHASRAKHDVVDEPRVPHDPIDALRFVRPRYDVAELAGVVGRRMGMASADLDDLEATAQLRDVGNMAIPAAVLANVGELSDAEWRFIRLHTLVGERLLAGNFGMERVARLVRSSHERWDGGGYPDGLREQAIPLGSRIVFVCSAFQDMTTPRAYRRALSAEEALRELQAGAGTQFDPAVVAAFNEAFASAQAKPPPERPAAPRQLRVLVAEDDAAARFLLRRALIAGGHHCLAAEDGRQAWELFREHQPEVVISDWLMPGMDGDELCRRIREDADAPYTYFVMLSALDDKDHVLRGMRAGADDFLTKPLDRHDLQMRLIAASRVTALHRRLQQQQQTIQAEIDLAGGIQRGLLPTAAPTISGIELAGRCQPAANVGGDYFDHIVDDQGRLVLLIADVAGHSISAALLMTMARGVLRREVGGSRDPARLLDITNRVLFSDLVNAELFITAFCARYDPRRRTLEYASAGHNPPLLRRASGETVWLEPEGTAMGILEDGCYELAELTLDPGDALLLYTDGIVEATDAARMPFGDARLRALIGECGGAAPSELIERVELALTRHAGERPPQDDVTMLALRVSAEVADAPAGDAGTTSGDRHSRQGHLRQHSLKPLQGEQARDGFR